MSTTPQPQNRAAGVFIALFTIAGVLIGTRYGQPSLGFLAGAGVGIATAIGYWLVRR